MDSMMEAQTVLPLNGMDQSAISEQEMASNNDPMMEADEAFASLVVARQKASEEWRKPYREEWDKNVEHYEQIYDDTGKEPWQSTTFQPMTTTHVERSTAALHNMSMGPELPGEYQPRNTEYSELIESTNDIIQHDLERSQFKVHWTDFLRILSLHGTAIGKIEYVKEEATILVKERVRQIMSGFFGGIMNMMGISQTSQEIERFVPKKMTVKDWATFKCVDIYNIYPQPGVVDFCKDHWVIEKFKITNKELVEGSRNPDPDYQLINITPELLMSGRASLGQDPETITKRFSENDTDFVLPAYDPDLEHEGFEYWGPVPAWMIDPNLKQDESRKYDVEYAWGWVIDGRFTVRRRRTPWRDALPPYVKGNYIRRSGQFYGIGNGQLLRGLQIEKNEIRNTRQDNINLLLNKIIGVLKDKISRDDFTRLESAPGAIWTFEGIDDIRKAFTTVDIPDIAQDSWRASAEVDREAQEATDVVKTTQTIGAGEDQAGNGTFRGQLLNKQQANERFMVYARLLEIVGLSSTIHKFYERIYQFKSYKQISKILGEKRAAKFELITPEELPERASWISLGALTNQNKGLALAQMRDWYLTFQGQPWVKHIEFARKWYRLGQMGADPDEVMFSDEELKIFNEQKRMMLQNSMTNGTPHEPGMPPMQGPRGPGAPVAGDVLPPSNGLPRPAVPATGPGAASIDGMGRPMS